MFGETPAPQPAMPENYGGSVGGILPMMGLADMKRMERDKATKENNTPVIQGLAGHVRTCFRAAYDARQSSGAEERMLKGLRQRRGEYDPEDLAEIRKGGGSEIFMMLTSNKCRGAAAWLKDVFLGQKDNKPWSLSPTPLPDMPPQEMESVAQEAVEAALMMEQQMGGMQMFDQAKMNDLMKSVKDRIDSELLDRARRAVARMEDKVEDQLAEGGFINALSEFLDDIVTYPSAILKGPVVRKKPQLTWPKAPGPDGKFVPVVEDKLVMEWERADPFMCFPSPDASRISDGYFIERHRLSRSALREMRDTEGYSNEAIDAVLTDYGSGGLREWLTSDTEKAEATGKDASSAMTNPDELIDAVQFWGSVQGQMLIDWGMKPEEVPDPLAEHSVEVWVIGQWVIKAVLNADPFSRRPYYMTSYEVLPGSFWGNAPPDLIRDCQRMCNAAARALADNMGISSGPQVGINIDRMPADEQVTRAYPWKTWQFTNDPYGSNSAPIEFFAPPSFANELMQVYEKFAVLADEYSGIPRYMTGDARAGGAGRTASGMSMLMSNAGKALKQVTNNIDIQVMMQVLERQYYYNMRFGEDVDLKQTDIKIVARGASSVLQKEQMQVRRNEFLQLVLSNPITAQVLGPEAIAEILRETAKELDMNTDKIIPPPEVIRFRLWQQQQAEMMAQAMAAQQPLEEMQIDRDDDGAMKGVRVMPGNRQQLQNGAPIVDNFAPARRA